MKQGRLQFRHSEIIFDSRAKAYDYLDDIVNGAFSEEYKLDESLMAEPIVVVYTDEEGKKQVLLCIGVEGEKGEGALAKYHVIDSAKLEKDIQEMSGATGELEQELRDEIERAIAREDEIDGKVSELSGATEELSAATVSEVNARKAVTGQEGDVYVPNQSYTSDPIAYIGEATSLNDADKKLDQAIQALDAETVKNIVVNGVEGTVEDNVASANISGSSIPIGEYEEYDGRANTPHPIHDDYTLLEAVKQVDTNSVTWHDELSAADQVLTNNLNDLSSSTVNEIDRAVAKDNELENKVNSLSSATKDAIELLDEKLDDEKGRAMSVENSLSGEIDMLDDKVESFSAATVDEIARLDAAATRNAVSSQDDSIIVTPSTDGTDISVNIDGKTILNNNGLKSGLKVASLPASQLESNVREAFRLVDNEGTPVDNTTIKIYKSSALVSVELIKVGDIDYVRITYIDNEGATQTMDLNIQQLIFEAEFRDGLTVNENGEVSVKIDDASEQFLTVSSNGVKLSGVQDSIDSAVDTEKDRAEDAEHALSDELSAFSAVVGTFSSNTASEFALLENAWNVPGSIKHTIDDSLIKAVAIGSAEEADKTLLRYYIDGDEHKYYASSNADDMYYEGEKLSNVISKLIDDVNELSAYTHEEIERLDDKIDAESERAINVENQIINDVTRLDERLEQLSGVTESFSAAAYQEISQLKEQLNEANETIEALQEQLQILSGVVENLVEHLDEAIYPAMKQVLNGTEKEIKITEDDANSTLAIGFAEDAVFGPISLSQSNG